MITANVVFENEQFQVVEVLSSEPSYSPSAIVDQAIPSVAGLVLDGSKGVVVSHRGTTWMNVSIAAFLKNKHVFVGMYDPKQGGAVVCSSTAGEVEIGSVIKIPKEQLV